MPQFSVPCAVYRGGTSRGLFFHQKDLPADKRLQKQIFMAGIDAYNPSQIDGLGSGTSHTSKVVVIAPSREPGVDVNYTFVQVGIGEPVADSKGTCGNLMAAAGAFAVDEGLAPVPFAGADQVEVSVFDTNIRKRLRLTVPVEDGKAKTGGDYFMPGVARPGAKYSVNILNPGGGKTGETLPLGVTYPLETQAKTYQVSFVDIVNPIIFINARSLGLEGTEPNSQLGLNQALLSELENIRRAGTLAVGMVESLEAAVQSQAIPKIALVSEPRDYLTPSNRLIKAEEVDIVAKMLSMGRVHRTFTGSGLYALAGALLLQGTIPNRVGTAKPGSQEQLIRVGHAEGVVEVRVSLTENGKDIASVGMDRTVRRIMKGELFIPGAVELASGRL